MATGRMKGATHLLNKSFLALVHLVLAAVTSFACPGEQGAKIESLPPNTPAIPTTIKNAPFTAQVVTVYDHVFANGNHIHRETRGRIFRDAQGRVRTETEVPLLNGIDVDHIAIQDPILHEVIRLDPRTKTASIYHVGDVSMPIDAPIHTSASKPDNVLVVTPRPGGLTGASTVMPLRPSPAFPAITASLGTKMMEGLLVVGTRTTRTFFMGQPEPIVSVSDSWISLDLQMVIFSSSDDGQAGFSTVRVTHVVRRALNEKLFQLPPDYTVKNGSPIAAVIQH